MDAHPFINDRLSQYVSPAQVDPQASCLDSSAMLPAQGSRNSSTRSRRWPGHNGTPTVAEGPLVHPRGSHPTSPCSGVVSV